MLLLKVRQATMSLRPTDAFYGWWIVAASFFIQLVVVGVALYAPPVFLLPLQQHFGWSRAAIAAGPGLAALVCGLVSPLVGAFTDRYGPRRVMLWGVLVLGVCEAMLSQITSIVHYYLICTVLPIGLAGAAWIPNQTLISNWFLRKRGAAMGVALTGIGVGGLIMASLAGLLIEKIGWRGAYVTLGCFLLFLVTPVVWAAVYDYPAEMGLNPDGEGNHEEEKVSAVSTRNADNGIFGKVLRSRCFWSVALVEFMVVLGSLSIIGHLPAFLADQGSSRAIAANILGITIGLSVVGRLFFGYLADRVAKKPIMVSTFGLFAIADLLLLKADHPAALVGFIILFGLALGGSAVLIPLLVGEYFGLRAFAKTIGIIMVAATAAAAVGPVSLGWIYDASGSYSAGFTAIAVVFVLGALAMTMTKAPSPPVT